MKRIKSNIKFLLKVIRHTEIIIKKDIDVVLENIGNDEMDSAFVCLEALTGTSGGVCIVSAGIGDQINFELDVLKRLQEKNVVLLAIDPTPKALQFLRSVELPVNVKVIPYALCAEDKKVEFSLPDEEGWVSGSAEALNEDGRRLEKIIEVEGKKLSTILKENGLQKIDLLKLDIEGSEFAVLDNILSEGIDIKQMTIDLHHQYMVKNKDLLKKLIKKLHECGYKICFAGKDNLNICCIKI